MAYTYLFFRPLRLPLTSQELSAETVLPLDDYTTVRDSLERVFPNINWQSTAEGHVTVEEGWMEFLLGPGAETLSLRCSLGGDYRTVVQRLCNELEWIAFDQEPVFYQPHQPPIPA
jgi:hypothetical protein